MTNRHLNLVKSDFEKLQKVVLPRFPFCFLTFKCSGSERVFEVKDISYSGMQLELKNGEHSLKDENKVQGLIHWGGHELEINGVVKWTRFARVGVEFNTAQSLRSNVEDFLSLKNIAKQMKPIHQTNFDLNLPPRLKYWLRSDGPVELFVWQHGDGELSHIQIIMMEHFVEWRDGKGLESGRVISKRDIDTPLISEDEYVFKLDPALDQDKIQKALNLINILDDERLPSETKFFITRKLG